jgi:hypothetical protein
VGPVIDVRLYSSLFELEASVGSGISSSLGLGAVDMFLPSVYDSLLVVRPSVLSREATLVSDSLDIAHISCLGSQDSYYSGMLSLLNFHEIADGRHFYLCVRLDSIQQYSFGLFFGLAMF